MPRGHDDKDPGSVNLDVGYIKINENSGKPIYKAYIRTIGIKPNAKVDYIPKMYGLVEYNENNKDIIAAINLADITTEPNGSDVFENFDHQYGEIDEHGVQQPNGDGHWTKDKPKRIKSHKVV